MAEIKSIPIAELKRGMTLAEDIYNGDDIIALQETIVSGMLIRILKHNNISEVSILIEDKPTEKVTPIDRFDIKNALEKITHAVLLYDSEIDPDLKIKRMLKSLASIKKPEIIEAADFVINYYEDSKAREFALQAIEPINDEIVVGTVLTALHDDDNSVRFLAQKIILNYLSKHTVLKLINIINQCFDEILTEELFGIFARFEYKELKPILDEIENESQQDEKMLSNLRKISKVLGEDEVIS